MVGLPWGQHGEAKLKASASIGWLLAVVLAAGCFGNDEPSPSPERQPVTYRWLRTELTIPATPLDIHVERITPENNSGVAEIRVVLDERQAALAFDASDGRVTNDTLSETEPGLVRSITDSVVVLDALPTRWPYVDEAAPSERSRLGRLSYPSPDPSAGIIVFLRHEGQAVVHSGSTYIVIDPETGELLEYPHLVIGQLSPGLQNEIPAFVRFWDEMSLIIDVPAGAN